MNNIHTKLSYIIGDIYSKCTADINIRLESSHKEKVFFTANFPYVAIKELILWEKFDNKKWLML